MRYWIFPVSATVSVSVVVTVMVPVPVTVIVLVLVTVTVIVIVVLIVIVIVIFIAMVSRERVGGGTFPRPPKCPQLWHTHPRFSGSRLSAWDFAGTLWVLGRPLLPRL